MILLLLFALAPHIQIVSGNDAMVTYRELVPLRVALDPVSRTFHYKGCPKARANEEWVSPAAAKLRGYKEHSCASARQNEYVTNSESRVPRDRAHIAVLFVGNSLTYFNEMPRMTSAIGAHEPRPLLVDSVTQSGASLEDLWFRTDALKRIWQEHWDYVILQERGGRAAMERGELFHQYLMMFAEQVRESGATPLLFMTWYPGNEKFFRSAAARATVGLLPVGLAWKRDFDWDGTHPDLFGSYLIACTVYSMIYGKPALGVRIDFRDLANRNEFYDVPLLKQSMNEEQAKAIQLAAWKAVKNR